MASIIVVNGTSRGNYFPLSGDPARIGRDEASSLQVLDDLVSREHLEIRYDEKAAVHVAVDLESANGVYINGSRITEPTMLEDQDVIRIGDSKIMFTSEDFLDREGALNFFQRGQHVKSTMIRDRDPE
jgi:pSer/pThr/pTyr-binding forkhead associated (FHA) protein